MIPIKVTIPIRTVSEANLREHWAERARRVRIQRRATYYMLRHYRGGVKDGPLTITITRIAPRQLDSDNLARSAKAVRDGIADAFTLDDADPRIVWRYDQRKGGPKEYAVEILIEQGTGQASNQADNRS